jgi:hypothetical protein
LETRASRDNNAAMHSSDHPFCLALFASPLTHSRCRTTHRIRRPRQARLLPGRSRAILSADHCNVRQERHMSTKHCDAEKLLGEFISKFELTLQRLIKAVRNKLRRRFPSAHEIAYDNYNFFVIGYSPTERPSNSIVSIAAAANGVGLCFIRGASLPDPKKILLGSGKQTRFIRLESVGVLNRPEVEALLAAAASNAEVPLEAKGRGKLIIRSVSAKQRPRRKKHA